jgi:hypothetical protein
MTGTLYCSTFERNAASLDPMVFNSASTFNGGLSVVNNDPFLETTFLVDRGTTKTSIKSVNIELGPTLTELQGSSTVFLNGTMQCSGPGFFSGGVYAPNLYLGGPGGGFNQFL